MIFYCKLLENNKTIVSIVNINGEHISTNKKNQSKMNQKLGNERKKNKIREIEIKLHGEVC